MTSKQIKDGMTKGVWVVDPANWSNLDIGVIDKEKYTGGAFVLGGMNQNFYELGVINAAAITNAVNSTWGNNLNPEVMPEMYKAMKEMQCIFYGGATKKEMDEMRILFDSILKKARI